MNDQYNEQMQLLLRSQRWKMAFFGLIILIAGLLIGAGSSLLIMGRPPSEQPPGVEFINERTISRLQHELNLTHEQTQQVKVIFDKHLQALHQIRQQARPQIAARMNQLHTEVMAILDEQQQELWTQNIQRLTERFIHPTHRPGPRDDGPSRQRRRPPPHRPFGFWQDDADNPPPPPPPGHHPDDPPPPRPPQP